MQEEMSALHQELAAAAASAAAARGDDPQAAVAMMLADQQRQQLMDAWEETYSHQEDGEVGSSAFAPVEMLETIEEFNGELTRVRRVACCWG